MLRNSFKYMFNPSFDSKTLGKTYLVDYQGNGLGFWINKLKGKEHSS